MRNWLNDKMTKQDSPSSIKQENAASGPNDLSDLVRIADEALKQEGDAGLTPDEDQANATDDKDNENADEDMRSFLSMVGSLKE